jgi:two-component system, sensor histidine kinase
VTETAPQPTDALLQDLQRFETRHSPNGLLLRYCRGRCRTFWARQMLTLVASLALAVMESWQLGLAVLLLNPLGDALDCLLLLHVWRRFQAGNVPPQVARLVALSGMLQAATIALCAVLAWVHSAVVDVEFFITALLTGAAINGGLIWPYQRLTASLKLVTFVGAWVVLIVQEAWVAPDASLWLHENAYYVIATLMLGYASFQFLRYVDKTFARNAAIEHDLLRNQYALETIRAALHLREAQARRLALVAENANDCVLICTPEGQIDWVNDTFIRTTGYTLAEVVGRTAADVLNAPGTDPASIAEILSSRRDRRPCRVELLNATKDGRHIWMDVSITPIFNADGSHAMTIQVERDMTEAKIRAEELAQANADAREAVAAKSRFLATMSHEIRTPMNGVIGMAELLSRTPLDTEQQGYLSAIIESGEALLSVINDILDLSKLQSGKMDVATAPFDIVASMQGVATLLRPLAKAKGIGFTIEIDATSALWVAGDAGRVRQILLNLAGNAVKFTRDGQVSIGLTATIQGPRAELVLQVQDTGIGIAPDRIETVFDSFTQADGAITREFGGTGLGLTISRVLARVMGGDVTVRSDLGQGSVFQLTLDLPVVAAPIATAPVRLDDAPLADAHILVAEDNRTNRLILRKMLEAPGVTLTEAHNGAEAVQRYADAAPHLIIMDMQMPVMDGLTAIRQIRGIESARGLPRCPIIVLTANAFSEDSTASFAADADDFLTKPVVRAILLARVSALLFKNAAQGPLTQTRRLA